MNKIKKWVNPKEYLPVTDRLVIIKVDEHDYSFARLWEINPDDGGKVYFLLEEDGAVSIELSDIKAWCYIELGNAGF